MSDDNSRDSENVENAQICRICLENSTRFYQIQRCSLDIFYELMTGISVELDHMIPLVLCWECAYRLVSFWKFKSKAKKANQILQDIFKTERYGRYRRRASRSLRLRARMRLIAPDASELAAELRRTAAANAGRRRAALAAGTDSYLSNKMIQSIDRAAHKLTSSLSFKTFNVNHSDLHLHDTTVSESPKNSEENYINYTLDLEVKNEDDRDIPRNASFNDDSNHSISSSDIVLAKHKDYQKDNEESNKKDKKKKFKKKNVKLPIIKIDKRKKPVKDVLNEDIFTITELSYEEQVLEVKNRQESSNYKRSDFVCEMCYKGFLDEEAYNSHLIRHTDQSGTFECKICKVRFRTQHALRNHTASHVHKFSCKRCSYVTTRRHAAKLHEEYHNGTKYQCPHCQEDFVKFSTYMSHVRLKHPSDFVCDRCGHSFVSAKGLTLHKKLKHRLEEQHPVPADGPFCERCDVRFASEEALHRHFKLSARHKDNTESKETARKSTKKSTNLHSTKKKSAQERRNKNCKPEGPIPCEQCDMQLPNSVSYYRHFRRSHPDKNRTNYPSMKTRCMCEVCGKMFQSLALLQDHSFTHTDLKQFKCAHCDKTFQRKYRLIAHRKLHFPQRTLHACSVCGKRFSTNSNKQRHMVSHTGLRPFKCEMCGKCFKHASEKRVHVTYVHLDKPWPKRRRGKQPVAHQSQTQPVSSAAPEDHIQPLWPSCSDSKVHDSLHKPVYYNLKI